jgi:endo-1,4-beta-xylanase
MRRITVYGAAALLAVSAGLVVVGHPAGAASTLGQLAAAKGRYFGTALEAGRLGTPAYAQVAGTEFGVVTPGNEMKWDATEPSRGTFSFARGDQIVAFAQAHGQRVRGHTLVWHSQLPGWVSGGGFSAAELTAVMQSHIAGVAGHFAGKVFAWDVVNEPFNDDGTRRASVFQTTLGDGYVATALRAARAADPNAKLYVNDYNTDTVNAKSTAMYNLVRSLQQQGVPIDGVGIQGHLILGQPPATLQQNIQRFADLGLDVALTELDIRMTLPATAAMLSQQAANYASVVNACLAVTRCVGITTWGVGDADSWVPGTFPGQGAALLYDANYQPKPAYAAVATALGGTTPPPPTTTSPPTTTPAPAGGCAVTYVPNTWGDGFTANVTVRNNGGAAITGWTLAFTFPGNQRVTNLWNGSYTQTGAAVRVANLGYNATIPAGGTQSFGFQGTYTGTNGSPAAFALNGTACG